jgi:nicotinate-nucleotide adenylyltransferase
MRLGLFGGTFDPIHIGHLRAALEVKQGFGLDRIVFIPAALPPHKKGDQVADAADRLKMVELGVSGYSGFSVSDAELQRSGPSYSIDTINHFKKSSEPDSEILFISGLDAFLEIDTWKSYRDLLRQIAFIVIARPIAANRLYCHCPPDVGLRRYLIALEAPGRFYKSQDIRGLQFL